MKIGFIGLGFMGGNMAARVLAGGFELRVHDLDRGKAASLLAGGAAWADSAQACADGVDLLITSLPGPKQCRAVMLDGGTIDAFKPGAIWCDMTTNERDLVAEIARRADARGVTVLDAPVTGAVDGARRGSLTIFAGGEGAAIDRIQPVLDCMGQTIRCGALGTGNAVKLVTNLLWFTHAAVLGEGLALGRKAGVDLAVLWDAIERSVGDSFVARHDAPSIFAGHYDPSFSLDLCVKDLTLAAGLAQSVGVPLPMGSAATDRFRLAAETYGGDKAELHVAKLIEDEAGIDLRLAGNWPLHWEA